MSQLLFRPIANIDGNISDLDHACIPVTDRGFLFGDSVYEVFRSYKGIPLFLEEHYARLENSARLIRMNLGQSLDQLFHEIKRSVRATGAQLPQEVYVRFQVTRGDGITDLKPNVSANSRCVIIVKPLQAWDPRFYSEGMKMAIPQVRRNPVNALDPNIKGGNYLNNILAIGEAVSLGADDCIILSRDNYVTEAANSNVWFVIDNELVTPGTGNLKGLTKAAILQVCQTCDTPTYEKEIHVDQIVEATECFVTSATREVTPVASIRLENGKVHAFPAGGGAITKEVHRLYLQHIDQYVARHRHYSLIPDDA